MLHCGSNSPVRRIFGPHAATVKRIAKTLASIFFVTVALSRASGASLGAFDATTAMIIGLGLGALGDVAMNSVERRPRGTFSIALVIAERPHLRRDEVIHTESPVAILIRDPREIVGR